MQGFFELCKVCELGKTSQMLSAPSSVICELCKAFYCHRKFCARLCSKICKACKLGKAPQRLCSVLLHLRIVEKLPKKESRKFFSNYERSASKERLRRCSLPCPPSYLNYAEVFRCPKKEYARFYQIMWCLRAGQGSTDAICSVLLHVWIMQNVSLPKKESCMFFSNYVRPASWTKLRRCYLLCTPWFGVYAKSFTAAERVLRSFCFWYAKVASWTRLHRCYLLCPPSCLDNAKFCTAQERVMQVFFDYVWFASKARLRKCYLLRPPSFLNYAMFLLPRKVLSKVSSNYARFASWARHRRCYPLRPPSV